MVSTVLLSFNSLVKSIPKYFIIPEHIKNGPVSFIFSSNISLLVYKDEIDFCMFILCPATLFQLLISYNSFLDESLRFSTYKLIASPKVAFWLLPFQFSCLFPPLSCLIPLVMTSSIILNSNVKSGHPCLVSERKSFQTLSIEDHVSCGFVVGGLDCIEVSFILCSMHWKFLYERVLNLLKLILLYLLQWSCDFYHSF